MSTGFNVAEKIVRAEYQRLCNVVGLIPVPLDIYLCDPGAPLTQETGLGSWIGDCNARYSGTVRMMVVPLCDGDLPNITTVPGFPPRNLLKHEWDAWRVDLWHEVVHQISNDICGHRGAEPGRVRPDGTRSVVDHGAGWFAGVQHLAGLLGVDPEDLDTLLDR